MCAWMITNFLMQTRRRRRRRGEKNEMLALRIPANKETDEQVITKREKKDTVFFQRACVFFFIAFMKIASRVDRTEWLEPLWHCCSSHTIILVQHHLFSSVGINLYARAKIEINGIDPQRKQKKTGIKITRAQEEQYNSIGFYFIVRFSFFTMFIHRFQVKAHILMFLYEQAWAYITHTSLLVQYAH